MNKPTIRTLKETSAPYKGRSVNNMQPRMPPNAGKKSHFKRGHEKCILL
jgi:hypothetical protein